MSRLVVDASVTMTWCFEDQATDYSRAARRHAARDGAVVPRLWPYEVTNVLATSLRRKHLTRAKTGLFLELLARFQIQVENQTEERIFQDVLSLAGDHGLTAYDAAYLELAVRFGLPLATMDVAMAKAARSRGLAFDPDDVTE